MDYSLHPLGDQAILIEFPQEVNHSIHAAVQQVKSVLENEQPDWLTELVPAFASVAVHYDIRKLADYPSPYEYVFNELNRLLLGMKTGADASSRTVRIPVLYGGEMGPDLEEVAEYHHLTKDEVIQLHTESTYTVYMLGFAPGFPYIGGMNEKIATPRKAKPRMKISAGSVGIAGKQTGVYPIETPGGWQIIGQTPEKLFRPENEEEPTLLQAGDVVAFYPISEEEFKERKERRG